MATTVKPLTKAQLIRFVQDYHSAFPDWHVEHDVVLVRSQGPLRQHIAFEALRDGAYRPSCSVEVLLAPEARVLARFLDIKHREVLPREHVAKLPSVVRAMESDFLPPVRRPLHVEKVLQLAEEDATKSKIETLQYSNALAALNAFVGNSDRALSWCDRVMQQIAAIRETPADWEQRQGQFAVHLREAILREEAHAFLDRKTGKQASET